MPPGKVRVDRMVKQAASAVSADVTVVAADVDDLVMVPQLTFAASPGNLVYVLMTGQLTAGTGATAAWVVRINAVAQTVSSVGFAANGLITITISANNLLPLNQANQVIDVAYTASGTNDLLDALGRTVPNWAAARGITLPRVDMTEADFTLAKEQAGNPTGDPATGYWRTFFKSTGMFVEEDTGTVTGPVAVNSATTVADASGGAVIDVEARAQLNALLAALRASKVIAT